MKLNWFKRVGVFFLPLNFNGWIILLMAISYAVYAFLDIDSRSHSASDTLMNFAANLLVILAVYSLIAYFTSQKSNHNGE